MNILSFDEAQLTKDIERLPPPLRAAFATACAERLRPAYLAFSVRTGRGNPIEFEAILDRLWSDLDGQPMTNNEIRASIESCLTLIPHEDDGPWISEQAAAEDAGTALAYALQCRQGGQSQEAAWAARRAYEALDHFVITHENVDMRVPGAEARVLSHPLVQAELNRQRRDLDELLGAASVDVRQAVAQLRSRAELVAATIFGVTS